MMNDLYRKYFQKSFTFLYPLLGFKKRNKHKPIQTYVMWEDVYNKDARKLICVYKRDDSEEWRTFEREHLVTHYMLDYCLPIDKDCMFLILTFLKMTMIIL